MTARAYPLPRPESGNDPRFTFGLQLDVAAVLEKHGFPKVTNGSDMVDLQMALFGFIYAADKPSVSTTPAEDHSPPTFAEYRDAVPHWQRRLAEAEAAGDTAQVERCRRCVALLLMRVELAESLAQRTEWHMDLTDDGLRRLALRADYTGAGAR